MTADFNKPFVGLDDQPILDSGKEIVLSKFLAGVLSQDVPSASKDSFKIDSLMRIAKSLFKTGKVDLTDSEYELVKEGITGCAATIMLKHQLLAVLSQAKSDAEKPAKEKK